MPRWGSNIGEKSHTKRRRCQELPYLCTFEKLGCECKERTVLQGEIGVREDHIDGFERRFVED